MKMRIPGLGWMAVCLMLAGCSPEAKVEKHLARGNAYFDEGKHREATLEYLNVLREDRTNQVAVLRSGLAHFELGNLQQAMAFLRAAEEADPENLEVRLKLGTIYRAARAIPQAREEALAILERDSDHFEGLMLLTETAFQPEELEDAEDRLTQRAAQFEDRWQYHLAMAQIRLRQGQLEETEDSLQRALQRAPEEPRVLEALGDLYALRGQRERAAEYVRRAAEQSEPISPTRVRWAALRYAQGQKEEALEDLRAMVAEDPEFVPAWLRLGEYALQERRFDDATAAMEAVLSVYPEHVGGRLLRARLRLINGETEEAVDELQALARDNPRSTSLQHQLGLAYLRDGKIDLARQALGNAVELDPDNVRAALQLAELGIRGGDPSAAIGHLEALITRRRAFPEAVLLLGRAYAANDEPQRALDTFRALEELDPDSHLGPFLQGEILLRQRENSAAREAFTKALERAPEAVPILSRLAYLDLQAGAGEAAIARVEAAIDAEPEQPGLHKMLGAIYARLDQPEAAEQAFRREMELAPEDMAAYQALSQLLMQQGRLDEALQQVEESLAVDPDSVRSLMLSAMFHERKKSYEAAVERYERVLELRPRFSQAANNAAYLYAVRLDQLDRAFLLAKQARDLAPDNPAIADTLGWIAYLRGEYPWALTLIQEASESFAENPEVLYHLGMVKLALGREAEAREILNQAAEADEQGVIPQPDQLRNVIALLRIPVEEATSADEGIIRSVLAADPDNPAARVREARMLEIAGDPAEAGEIYQSILEDYPQFLPAVRRRIDLLAGPLEKPGEALDLALQARAEHPEDAAIAHRAGWLAIRQGDLDRGHGLLQEARRLGADGPRLGYQLALSYYLQGDQTQARRFCDDNPNPGPEGERFCVLLGGLLQRPAGEAALELAQSVSVESPLYLPARMVLAEARKDDGEWEAAAAIYDALLGRAPEFIPAAREAAALYAGPVDDLDRAHSLATQARRKLPRDPAVAALLGKIMTKRQEYGYAVSLLTEALGARPDDAESLYLLGFAQHGLDQSAEARRSFDRALALDPESDLASKAREILSGKSDEE